MLRVNGNVEANDLYEEKKKKSSLWCRKFEAIARHNPEKYEHNEWINSYSHIPDIKICAPLYPKHSVHGQWQSGLNCIFIKIHIKWTKRRRGAKKRKEKFEAQMIWIPFYMVRSLRNLPLSLWNEETRWIHHSYRMVKWATQCEQITLSFSILFFGLVITYYMHTYK